ncbi:nitroreductase family protein [Actinomarinicola tropica]|uniref:Nitroreductase n=1 Tax=Actinomarinicola tropica TaxID=2789776 RepID=A0A5Q2RD12_9ACTN|nr:nitroreductase family protein [Actinomarinicola tropica]QGG94779.1 nitroreductase [Actinomarinicola tropica]
MSFEFDLQQVDHLLTTTRAVRKRLDLTRPVPRELILECLEVAVQAPTGGNTQRWRWVVVDEPEKKAALADMYREGWGPYLESQKAVRVKQGLEADTRVSDSADYLADHFHEVPAMLIPCLLDRGDGPGYWGSVLPAAWSFMLAARSRGLGTALTTIHLMREREASELLGIPDTVSQAALIPVGYYTGDDFKPAKRRPAAEITYFNEWKQTLGS